MTNYRTIRLMALKLATAALTIAACLGFSRIAFAESQEMTSASTAFAKMKSLAGTWEASTSKGRASATYRLVSGGAALLESFTMPGEKEMITVYYLDGTRLLLTHYCEEGNQPRMQADGFDASVNAIEFHFLDATSLSSPEAGHMHNVVIKFRGPNEVAQDWTFYQGGKPALTVPIVWHRVE